MTKQSSKKGRTENVFQEGPYVIAALLCETLLVEGNSNVKSAIRIVDRRLTQAVGKEIPVQMPAARINWTLLIKIVKGKAHGKHELTVRLISPRGKQLFSQDLGVNLEGDENRGVDFVAKLDVSLDEEGIYWVEIYYDGMLMTKSPIQLLYETRRDGSTDPGQIQ